MSENSQFAKIQAKVDGGNFYEAEQLCRTFYFRLKNQSKYDAAVQLLEQSVQLLAKHQQFLAAAALASLILEAFNTAGVRVSDDSIDRLVRVARAFPSSAIEQTAAFLNSALKWSSKHGGSADGDSRLHLALARAYREHGDLGVCQQFYARARAPQEFAEVLQQYFPLTAPSERDLVIARAILLTLCAKDIESAEQLLPLLISHSAAKPTPILNFSRFVVEAVKRNSLPLFNTLRSKYTVACQRDPAFSTYLDRIAHVFFNVQPPSMGGMLGDLMKSFMSDEPAAPA